MSQKKKFTIVIILAATALVTGVLMTIIIEMQSRVPSDVSTSSDDIQSVIFNDDFSIQIDFTEWTLVQSKENLIKLEENKSKALLSIFSHPIDSTQTDIKLDEVKTLDKFSRTFELLEASKVNISDLELDKLAYKFRPMNSEVTTDNYKYIFSEGLLVYKFIFTVEDTKEYSQENFEDIIKSIQFNSE